MFPTKTLFSPASNNKSNNGQGKKIIVAALFNMDTLTRALYMEGMRGIRDLFPADEIHSGYKRTNLVPRDSPTTRSLYGVEVKAESRPIRDSVFYFRYSSKNLHVYPLYMFTRL